MKIKLTDVLFLKKKGLLILIMRTFIFLLCATMFGLTPNYMLSQNTKISIEEDKMASVDEVFKIIKEQTNDYMFIYPENLFKDFPKVQLKKGIIKLNKLLEESLSGGNVNVTVTPNNTIIIKEKSLEDRKQRQVSGKVIDELGKPIPGVTVLIKGTTTGVSSDIDGSYSILVPDIESVLVFSSIGYKTQEIKVGNQTTINITLKESINELDEVIINGIYERKTESFTGSAITVTQEELRRVGSQNIFQAIQNIDPSIALMDNFDLGSNPNALPDMQIRGTSTFPQEDTGNSFKGNYLKNPNQPLFILNGFEVSVERVFDLDFNRIVRLTVLKDAASKALYGAKAANGVVVIETNTPSGKDVLVTYTNMLDLEFPDLSSYNLTNSLQKLEAERIDGLYKSNNPSDPERQIALTQLYNERLKLAKEGLDTDWLAKPLQNGIGQRHSLSVELGGGDLRVLANLNYQKSEGVMKGSERKTIGGDFTTFYRVKNLRFKNITSVISNKGVESPYGEFSEYAKMNPYWRAENSNGSIPYYAGVSADVVTSNYPSGFFVVGNSQGYTNPIYNTTLNTKNESSYFTFENNFYLEWDINSALKTITRVGINVKKSDADEFYPGGHTMFESLPVEQKGSYQVNNGESTTLTGDFNLQYSKNINKSFLFGNIGINVSESKFNELSHTAVGFPSGRLDDIIFARDYALDSRPIGISGISRDIGLLAIGSYVYDNRFLSDVTLRKSASSQFGEDKLWATFWSLGLGWNLHNESFFKNSFIDQFKIRGSIGSTGNQNFNENQSIVTYKYYLDSQYQGFPGSYVENIGNPGLQWESKFDYNAGLDAKIGNLNFRFDYYESYTENLISDITIPYSTGFDKVKENLGKVKNTGIELNTSYLLWSKDRNFFSVNFGISTNKNQIVKLSDAMRSYNESQEALAADKGNNKPVLKYQDGMSLNAIWAVPSLGIDPATGNEIYVKQDGSTTYEWSSDDLIAAGNSNPDYRGVFGFSGEYNGFGLSVTARYLGGGQLYNQTLIDKVENVDMRYNVDERVITGRWQTPGQQALFKRLGIYSIDPDGDNVFESRPEKTRATTRFVQDRDELSIAAISAYYEFQKNVTTALGIERLRFMFNMNDVYTFSSIRLERGTEYPFSRSMSFSITANF